MNSVCIYRFGSFGDVSTGRVLQRLWLYIGMISPDTEKKLASRLAYARMTGAHYK